MWVSRDPLLKFWDPLYISVTFEARNVKIGKIRSNEVTWGSRDHFWHFGIPLISRERLKLENSNLANRWTAMSTNEKKFKIRSKGVTWGHVTHFWNFGTPLYLENG